MRINVQSLLSAARSIPEREILFWPGAIGRRLRAAYWGARLGAMGRGCIIDVGVIIQSPEHVFLGDNVWLDSYTQLIAGPPAPRENLKERPNPSYRGKPGAIHLAGGNHIAPFCLLQGHGGLWLGRDVGVAAHSAIYSLSNHYRNSDKDDWFDGDYDKLIKFSPLVPHAQQALVASPVVFEDGSALGLGSAVLPGATVGRYSWIGAGSVVHGAVPEGVIAGGNPLRVIKQRFKNPLDKPHG